jgi:hypothetical protein
MVTPRKSVYSSTKVLRQLVLAGDFTIPKLGQSSEYVRSLLSRHDERRMLPHHVRQQHYPQARSLTPFVTASATAASYGSAARVIRVVRVGERRARRCSPETSTVRAATTPIIVVAVRPVWACRVVPHRPAG